MRRFVAIGALSIGLFCARARPIDTAPTARPLPISTIGMETRGCQVESRDAGLLVVTGRAVDYPGITLQVGMPTRICPRTLVLR